LGDTRIPPHFPGLALRKKYRIPTLLTKILKRALWAQ